MTKREIFRKGALGALIDEYENAIIQFNSLIISLDNNTYWKNYSTDKEFGSINLIAKHVVEAGEIYLNYIKKEVLNSNNDVNFDVEQSYTPQMVCKKMLQQIKSLDAIFNDYWDMTDKQMEAYRFETSWGTIYDLEQLLEHAIVHVYRHKRQIERELES